MANNQQVRVDLQFKGDTSDVEKKLQQLQNTLLGITSGKSLNNLTFGPELNKAIGDATKLQAILKNTTMANGNLDLTKFRSELQKSGLSVKELGNSLLSLGPKGSQAFSQLTQSIINAEVPLKRTSTLLSNFATTLKNTAKWQISSSILHGFMSSISSAYGYAQDLNESLNNIRIVSKQNTEQMAEFAQEANKAAKELSVSTTAYTDAALIFYQQGLEGDAVTERTDVVAKMSNVTRDSVDEVSSYMTAIWNNFDDGSESLEHYADVITGLGAATASSSAEIAAGLEKFAAVADTVGLSYDYATSALATVVAQTRQSADTVGTAFKTLFARIEGLQLGETAEDGVDLNKYSKALATIGVNIMDANGQLKEMDAILDEMGSKWNTISKEEQVAVAQTVAGTRQYNQLVALMDNWDKVQENLQVARSSDGELQAQADIYAESWEAAQKRVRAAWESIYSSLFDDELFIKLTNGVGSFIEGLDKVIKSLGGLKGILPIITAGLMNLFNKDIANGINNFVYNLQIGTKKTQNELIGFKEQFSKVFQDFTTSDSFSSGAAADAMANQASFQQAILDKQRELNAEGKDFSETEKMINNLIAERISLVNEEMINTAKETESLQEQLQVAKQKADLMIKNHNLGTNSEIKTMNSKIQNLNSELNMPNPSITYQEIIEKNEELQNLTEQLRIKMTELIQPEDLQELQQLQEGYGALSEQYKIFVDTLVDQGPEAAIGTLEKIKDTAIGLGLNIGEDTEAFEIFENVLNNLKVDAPIKEQQEAMLKLADIVDNLGAEAIKNFESIAVRLQKNKSLTEEDTKALQQYFETLRNVGKANINSSRAKYNANATLKAGVGTVQTGFEDKNQIQKPDIGVNFANATKAAMNFGSALNSVNTLIDRLMDKEASFGDKMLAILTNGSMAAMMMSNSFKAISSLITPVVKNIELLTTNEEVLNTLSLKTLTIKKAEKAELEQQLAIETNLTSRKEIEKEIETINLTIEKLQTKEGQKQLVGEIILSSYKEGEVGFMTALLAISKLQTAEDKKRLAIELIREGLRKTGTKFVSGIKTGLGTIKTLITGITGLLGISAVTLGIIVAAIAVAVVAYKDWQRYLKEIAAEDKKSLEIASEKRQILQEECESVKELTDAYKQLKEAENDLSPEEMKSKVFDLCIQYGEETLAVKALAGEYENLNDELNELQRKKSTELVNAAQEEKNAIRKSAISTTVTKAGHRADNWGDTLDLKGLGAAFDFTSNGKFKADLEKLGLNISSGSGKIETSDLIDVIMANPEEFERTINGSATGAAKQLQEIYQELQPQLESLKGANEALKENLANNYNTDSIKSITDYNNAIDALSKQGLEQKLFVGENAEKQARLWAKQALTGVSEEIDKFAQENIIAEALAGPDATQEIKERISKTLASLPKEVSEASIAANIDLIKILGNGDIEAGIKKFANKFGDLVEYNSTIALGNSLNNVLNKDEKDPINESDISSLYEQGFNPGMSQEQFMGLDQDQQLLIISDYYMNVQDWSEETKEKVINDITEQINELTSGYASAEEAVAHYTAQAESAETSLNNTAQHIAEWASKEYNETWNRAYIERLAAAENELTEEERANEKFMEDRKKFNKISEEHWHGNAGRDINFFKDQLEESKEYANSLKQLSEQLNSVKEGSYDLKSIQQGLDKAMKLVNEKTDNIQQAFQNLNDTVAEYNENGFVTMDTLQKLWQMDNQYLASLELVDGQLKLNEKTFEVLANAQIDTMEAEALLQLQTDLLTDSENAEANTASAIAAGGASKIGTLTQVIAKVKEGTAAWREYATEQALAMTGQANLSDNQKNAIDAFYNKISLAESFRKQIGTKNFGTAMNVKNSKGGGGSKKDKEEKELKEWADEFDRFYPLQKVIDDLTDAISDLAKEQEHLAGGELIGAIRKQNKLLQEQKKAYQDLAKEQKAYQKEMQADLAKYGMSFDTASGNIVNYAEATQAMLDQYNAAIEKYNKSAQEDADKKALEAVEKEYEKFKKLVSNYQGILTEIQDTENELDDIYYETIANNLKEFEIMVQVNLDIREAERTVNDFINKINKNFKTLRKSTEEWLSVFDNALKNAHTYMDGEYGTINVDLDAYNKVKNAIDSGDYGHEGAMFASETEAITKLKELGDQLKDDAESLYELYTDAWDEYLEAVDEAIDMWDEVIENFDDINDTLDHYEKVIELLHGTDSDESLELLSQLYQQQVELSIAKQATLRKEIDTLEEEYQELIAAGANENDEDVKKIKEAIKNANKELESTIESYIDTIQKELENSITIANNTRQKSLWGNDINTIKEDWEMAKKASEGYYDSVQKIYNIDKLNDGYKKLINETKSLKTRKLLAEFQDKEINKLQKINKLTEHDVEIAEKQLELKRAEIALQEAQDNKSTMRLQRDSQGNWTYQFVANEEDIEDKYQAIEDKANEIRDLTIQSTKEATEAAMEYEIEFYTKATELAIKYKDDKDAFEREYAKLVEAYYGSNGLITLKLEESERYKRETNKATSELLFALYKDDVTNYDKMTADEKALIDDLKEKDVNSFDDMLEHNIKTYDENDEKANQVNQNTIKYWQTMAAEAMTNMTNIKEHTDQCYNDIIAALNRYNAEIERSEQASGIAWSNVGQAIKEVGNEIDKVNNKVQEVVNRTQALSNFRARVEEIGKAWNSVKSSVENALNSLNNYLKKLRDVKEMQDKVKANETTATGSHEYTVGKSSNNGSSSNGYSSGAVSSSSEHTGSKNNYKIKFDNYSYWEDWNHTWRKPTYSVDGKGTVGVRTEINDLTYEQAQDLYNQYMEREHKGSVRVEHYKTGGYTGSWSEQTPENNNGRLAWLHQKELVLNQSDTKNILDAVDLVRTIKSNNSDFINYIINSLNAGTAKLIQALEYGINSIADRVAYTSDIMAQAVDRGSNSQNPPEQNVHIEASFPNVNNSFEIETALNNLVNVASQRANTAQDYLI